MLMLFYLFSAEELRELFERLGYPFEYETIPKNVTYYSARSSHGSTLCRVVHAWVLARSDRPRSMIFFAEALQSDVADIQQGTTSEGVHLGAMAGSVDLVERVSTGIEVQGDVLRLNPELPQEMERLDMRIRYRGHSLDLRLTRDALTVRGRDREAAPISLSVDGKVYEFVGGTTRVFPLHDEVAKRAILRKESRLMPSGACILTVNGGSSSIKFALYVVGNLLRRILDGSLQRIGLPEATLVVNGSHLPLAACGGTGPTRARRAC